MVLRRKNNHRAKLWPNEDERITEQAFLRLGAILAEMADDLEEREANIGEDTARNKDTISTSQKNLDTEED